MSEKHGADADTAIGDSYDDQPVTVVVKHKLLPGKQADFKDWVHNISSACSAFPGYISTEVTRPLASRPQEYVCIFRYDNVAHLEAWMASPERQHWLQKLDAISEEAPQRFQYKSLEFWFDDGGQQSPPPRWLMTLVTFIVIFPLVHFIPPNLAPLVPGPGVAGEAVSVAVVVSLMSYLVMPRVTAVLNYCRRRWAERKGRA